MKGNETYNNITTKSLPLLIPKTTGVGSKVQKHFFLIVVILHIIYQVKGNVEDRSGEKNFRKSYDLAHTLTSLVGLKGQILNAYKYILI